MDRNRSVREARLKNILYLSHNIVFLKQMVC